MDLSSLCALILDMDGVLYRGETPVAGASDFLAWLAARGIPFLLVTNNSTLDPEAYQAKLARMGIAVPAAQILTSGIATADYLARNFSAQARVYMVGESGLEHALRSRGFTLTSQDPDAVVVGMDRGLTYDKLRAATLAIRAGARFIATNPDRTLPTEAGLVPGAGAIVAAIAAATDRTPVVIGKPEPPLLEAALAQLGRPRACTALVGDRLETDIAGARRLGLPAILVLSGVTSEPPPPESEVQPDWVFPSVRELHRAWEKSLAEASQPRP
jgi:4-nitrophenyl phosphatase